jgi:hypothetical protein
MDFNVNSTRTFINPYAKGPAAAASQNNDGANDAATNSVVTDFTMGIQSQLRGGAIQKCKEKATKRKSVYKQHAIGGGMGFVSDLHCKRAICHDCVRRKRGDTKCCEMHSTSSLGFGSDTRSRSSRSWYKYWALFPSIPPAKSTSSECGAASTSYEQ